MGVVGFQVGRIAIVIEGVETQTHAGRFAPTDPPTLRLQAIPDQTPLWPSEPARVEQDSWAGFSKGGRASIAIKIPVCQPSVVARVDLPEDGLEGTLRHIPSLPIKSLSYPLDQLLLMHALSLRGGVLMHGAAIAGPRGGFLVVGPSGAGKTTMARAAAPLPGARVLSDERSVVRWEGSGWVLDGTPWYGEGQFAERATVPLLGVMWLEKSDSDEILPFGGARALANLYRCHFSPAWFDSGARRTLDHLERLVREVPLYRLRNRKGGAAAAELIRRASA